jgi:membrane protein DedA with SNARE-associated domain
MLHFVHTYGIWLLATLLAIECSGIPVPGETTLIAWAVYAGTVHTVDIGRVIAAAAIGAITGNVAGYLIGRSVGYRVLVQHGSRIGFSESRFKIGHYLFRHYGIAAVTAGRFLPLLRSALPILAGANRMAFWPFLFATIAGGIAWVTCVGFAAFYFGVALVHLSATAMILVGAGVAILVIFTTIYIRRHEAELLIKAEREIPGPLPKSSFRRTRSAAARFADNDPN